MTHHSQPWDTPQAAFMKNMQGLFGTLQRGGQATYEAELQEYTKGQLERALKHLKENYTKTVFPRLADIIQSINTTVLKGEYQGGQEIPWEKADRASEEKYTAYMNGFESRPMATEARKEGWESYLLDYVKAWAWVQSQVAANIRCIGWDTKMVKHLRQPEDGSWDAAFLYKKYIAPRVRDARDTGYIEVSIPTTLINEWKALAQKRAKC